MIPLPSHPPTPETWRAAVDRELRDCLVAAQADAWTDAVAQGCAEALAETGGRGACLEWTAARALRSLGADRGAGILLARLFGDRGGGDYLPLLDQPDRDGQLWTMCAAGVLRAAPWRETDGGPAWLLDFTRLNGDAAAHMDLFRCRFLRQTVALLAPAWDAAQGQGSLALKGIATSVRRQARSACSHTCSECLERLRIQRHWRHVPRMILL